MGKPLQLQNGIRPAACPAAQLRRAAGKPRHSRLLPPAAAPSPAAARWAALEQRVLLSGSPTGLSGTIDSTRPSPLSFSLAPKASASATVSTSVTITPPIKGNVDVLF